MLEIYVSNKRTNLSSWLKLPISRQKLEEVIYNPNDFFIRKIKCADDIRVCSNDNILELNKQLFEFMRLDNLDKNKVRALNLKGLSFIEAMQRREEYEFIEGVKSMIEYGEYIAKHEISLPKRFLRYIDFKQYGEEVSQDKEEIYFSNYGVIQK